MKIIEITFQLRRDFTAIFECENCGAKIERGGYDDRNFHDKVIPNLKCDTCGKSRKDLGLDGGYTPTKYNDREVI